VSDDYDFEYKYGFAAGIYYSIGLSDTFSIQPEILYSQMGSEFSDSELELDYISVPILLKFGGNRGEWAIFAGPQFDYLLSAEYDGEDKKDEFAEFDFAATIGWDYWFTKNFGMYFKFNYGFTDIDEAEEKISNMGFQTGLNFSW